MKNPFRSLPARIVLFVFAAVVLTSLTVTAVSVNTIDSFLRSDIDRSFPAVLDATASGLEVWYEQRLREITVFSESDVLAENLPVLKQGRSSSRRARAEAEAEIEQYIGYVLDGFPQYAALFVLDDTNAIRLSVGERVPTSEATLEALGQLDATHVGQPLHLGSGPVQIVSAPMRDDSGQRLGSLHAVLGLRALEEVLLAKDLGESARIVVVDREGRHLAGTADIGMSRQLHSPSIPQSLGSELQQYATASGELMVGSTRPYSRFDWTLIVEQPYAEAFAPVVTAIGNVLIINLAIVLVVGLLTFKIAVSIIRPIEALSDAAGRISSGERDVVIPESSSSDEVGVLTRAFRGMMMKLTNNALELEESHAALAEANGRLQTQNEELQSVNEVLEQLSITDGLTKLNNHRFFQEALLQECKRSDRTGEALSLVLIDIDYFKHWNDRLGHAGGDEILRRMAEVMTELLRESDVIARYGGEEFAILTPNTDIDGAAILAEKLRDAVASTRFLLEPQTDHPDQVTISIGVSSYARDHRNLFNDADRALYSAKEAGRDCVIRADEIQAA